MKNQRTKEKPLQINPKSILNQSINPLITNNLNFPISYSHDRVTFVTALLPGLIPIGKGRVSLTLRPAANFG